MDFLTQISVQADAAIDCDQQEVVQFHLEQQRLQEEARNLRKRQLLRRLRRNAKHAVLFIPQVDAEFADLYTTDLEVALAYLKWTYKIYPLLGPLRRNRQVMEAAIEGDNVEHFDGSLIDLPLWKKCLAHCHDYFADPPDGLPAAFLTQETLRECICENGYLIEYLLEVDKEIGLIAVQSEQEALELLPSELYQNDVDFALAITYGGGYYCHLLQAFSFEIRANFQVILAAVRANGSSLRYASLELRRHPLLCFTAVREDPEALFSCILRLDDTVFPWAEPLICVAIGKKWTQAVTTRKIFAGIAYGAADSVKAYTEDVLRSARGFDLLCLHFEGEGVNMKKDEGVKVSRFRKDNRLNKDSLRLVQSFLSKGSLYKEAEYALSAIQQLEADEPRHRAQLLAERAKAFERTPEGRRLARLNKTLA